MNESDFEKSLRALCPVAPSPGLSARIREELAESTAVETLPTHSRFGSLANVVREIFAIRLVRDLGWACAGAATAVAIITVFHRLDAPAVRLTVALAPAGEPVVEPDTFALAETSRELLSAEDSDELFETDEGPARQVRYSYREVHTWANPRTGARVELEVPREDVFFLPVSMQ